MSVLDDLKMIHNRDKSDALGIAGKQLEQYIHNFGFNWAPERNITDVIVAGMGGSGLAAKAFKSFAGAKLPYEIIQDYSLPAYAHQNSLLICSSYSGNTEETLSVFHQALESDNRPMIVVIASGGKLIEMAKEHDLPYIQFPGGFQPRYTFGYQYRALCEIALQAGLTDDLINDLEQSARLLEPKLKSWAADVPTVSNSAKQMALELVGSSTVIYASSLFRSVAYKWKISINENAKSVAWWDEFPEFNHNEFLGWTSHPIEKPYKVVNLTSSLDHPQINKRFMITEKLLSGQKPAAEMVNLEGDTALEQMMYGVAFGDFVSLYLALLNGLDPTPVDIIEKLKQELI
jgi:glucose/mannose-6-phosphate isomerase